MTVSVSLSVCPRAYFRNHTSDYHRFFFCVIFIRVQFSHPCLHRRLLLGRFSVDLWPWFSVRRRAMVMTHTNAKKTWVKGLLVQKIEWKQTDGRTRPIALRFPPTTSAIGLSADTGRDNLWVRHRVVHGSILCDPIQPNPSHGSTQPMDTTPLVRQPVDGYAPSPFVIAMFRSPSSYMVSDEPFPDRSGPLSC